MATDGSSSISVAVRIRPLSERESCQLQAPPAATFINDASFSSAPTHRPAGLRRIVKALDDRILVFDPPEDNPIHSFQKSLLPPSMKKSTKDIRFCFDKVFDESATQTEVYNGTGKQLVDGVLSGFNSTVFAYGATGCGKTHTISGSAGQPGVIFLIMKDLFERVAAREDEIIVELSVSYLEIYNESIRDLLAGTKDLQLRESESRITIPGLSERTPTSAEDVVQIILEGNANRQVSATDANAHSSRSHAVLCVNVKQRARTADITEDFTLATLSVIDLAGSERASVTKNKGERLLEGANINRSLLALGSCINALCDPRKTKNHVPYRNSKLTRLLKHSLGGNCKTVMIVCISPASVHYDETHNTLQYANRAKEIKTKVTRNVVSVDRHVSQYLKIIYELKQELASRKAQDSNKGEKARDEERAATDKAFAEVNEASLKVRRAWEDVAEKIAKSSRLKALAEASDRLRSHLNTWKSAVPLSAYSFVESLISNHAPHHSFTNITDIRQSYDNLLQITTKRISSTCSKHPHAIRIFAQDCRVLELELEAECVKAASAARIDIEKHFASVMAAIYEYRSSIDEADSQAFDQATATFFAAFSSGAPVVNLKKRTAAVRSPLPDATIPSKPAKLARPSMSASVPLPKARTNRLSMATASSLAKSRPATSKVAPAKKTVVWKEDQELEEAHSAVLYPDSSSQSVDLGDTSIAPSGISTDTLMTLPPPLASQKLAEMLKNRSSKMSTGFLTRPPQPSKLGQVEESPSFLANDPYHGILDDIGNTSNISTSSTSSIPKRKPHSILKPVRRDSMVGPQRSVKLSRRLSATGTPAKGKSPGKARARRVSVAPALLHREPKDSTALDKVSLVLGNQKNWR